MMHPSNTILEPLSKCKTLFTDGRRRREKTYHTTIDVITSVILFYPSLCVCFIILSFRVLLLRSLLEDLPPPILLYFSFTVLVEFRSESSIDSIDGDLNMVSVVEPGND